MGILQHAVVPSTGGYQIERSLRFNSADSAYLNRTPASAGSRRTFTFSKWVKRSQIGTSANTILSVGTNSSDDVNYVFKDDNRLDILCRVSSSIVLRLITTAVYRDPSAWYHIVVAIDTTQATSSNRAKLYVNGTQVTAFDTATYPSQNQDLQWNNNVVHHIGVTSNQFGSSSYLNGYMTDVYFIDGQALTPSSFGENDTDTGVWKPKAYSGTYGTNGFYLKFADNSGTTSTTLGKDSSGNGNNWTPNNFSVTAGAGNDSLVDTPTPYGSDTGAGGEVRGNYATLNPLDNGATLANGNLNGSNSTTAWQTTKATFGMTSGKWYWEFSIASLGGSGAAFCGITQSGASTTNYVGSGATGWGYYSANGNKYNNGSSSSYGNSYTTNDIIGVAFDADNGELKFYKNGTVQNSGTAAYTGLTSGPYFPSTTIADGSIVVNFGQRPFAYTAPSGFKALCTTNLPTPAIGATSTTRADDYFAPTIYTGDGTTPRSITVGFAPDFVWHKSRSTTADHQLFDSVRGAGKGLYTNGTYAEYDYGTGSTSPFISFDSNGYTVGTGYNGNGLSVVSWAWKGGGTGVSNTQGTITSTVSANTTSGFSIVTYTGTGSAATVGHGLGVAPSMVIVKKRSTTSNWVTWHTGLTGGSSEDRIIYLDLTNAQTTVTDYWGTGGMTSTTFGVWASGGDNNASGATFVAYCFAPVAGYSAFGSYTGNGSSDGPFVYTGFRPAFVINKRTDSAGPWTVFDSKRCPSNVNNAKLFPHLSDAEVTTTGDPIDFLSNGYKLRGSGSDCNVSGGTYIFMAFAENPFKYSLAR